MELEKWLSLLIFGGLVGAIGQGIRAAAGLKKLNDMASSTDDSFKNLFETNSLVISLIIGFIAGALGALSLQTAGSLSTSEISGQTVITLLGIGYAGTDFIEAFMKKHGPEIGNAVTGANAGAASPKVNVHDQDDVSPASSPPMG